MIELTANGARKSGLTVLFLGAHSDDIEIGCGGAVLDWLPTLRSPWVHWLVLSGIGPRAVEARRSARLMLGSSRRATVDVREFPDCTFPAQYAALKACFEDLKRALKPDIIFTHQREDLHQDHRVISELTWNTFRNHLILEYEIPKFDGGLGSPSVFVPVSERGMQRKIATLMKVFATQRSRAWFSPETFAGLMRLRGIECNSPSGYAEAFYSRKLVLGGRRSS